MSKLEASRQESSPVQSNQAKKGWMDKQSESESFQEFRFTEVKGEVTKRALM